MTRRANRALRLFGLLPPLVASAASAAGDADMYALIDALRPVAEAITVDGNPADWGAIPAFSDPSGDSGGDSSRDITSVRIAPTASALHVLIETAGAPSAGGYAFWIRFDFMGEQYPDVELALDAVGPDGLTYFEETGCSNPGGCSLNWDGSTFAIGSAVEIRVPYAALDAVLPPSMQGKLTGAGARSWVRVLPHAVDYLPSYTEVEHGSAVASFRLVTTPYALDPPLPPGGDAYTALPDPLPGLWYVGQGAFTHGTHAGYWGYDLHQTDNALRPESPAGSTNLTDNFSFGQPILAPVAGTVYSMVDSEPDQPAYTYSPPPPDGPNFLFLEIPGSIGLLFSHTKQGTIPYPPGNPVAANALVGQVGHSGAVGWPHLHYGAETIPAPVPNIGLPLGITNADVGLNPTSSDPWRRTIASWGIREGFFVLPEPSADLVFVVGVVLLALLSQIRRVRASSAARGPQAALRPRRARP